MTNAVYEVTLKRSESLPNVIIFCDEDREKAIKRMNRYVKKNGFSVKIGKDRFSIADVLLVKTERIAGKAPLSITTYRELFDCFDNRIQ